MDETEGTTTPARSKAVETEVADSTKPIQLPPATPTPPLVSPSEEEGRRQIVSAYAINEIDYRIMMEKKEKERRKMEMEERRRQMAKEEMKRAREEEERKEIEEPIRRADGKEQTRELQHVEEAARKAEEEQYKRLQVDESHRRTNEQEQTRKQKPAERMTRWAEKQGKWKAEEKERKLNGSSCIIM